MTAVQTAAIRQHNPNRSKGRDERTAGCSVCEGFAEWPAYVTSPTPAIGYPATHLPMPPQLAGALAEPDDVPAYAEQIGVDQPSPPAFANARRLLKSLYRIAPRAYSVYPTAGGHIAIDTRGGKGRIAAIQCDSDGSVLCLVSISSDHRRARYSSAHNLPDAFIREALAEL